MADDFDVNYTGAIVSINNQSQAFQAYFECINNMIKIINNKKYDTAESVKIGEYIYSNQDDDQHVWETLYKSAKGQYYLSSEGGPASRYRKEIGSNSWSRGSKDELITEQKALEWCQLREVSAITIVEHFESILEEG